jgi:hypothetical protein
MPRLNSSVQYTKYSFLTAHFFTLLVTFAQQPGQAVVLGRLSLVSTKTCGIHLFKMERKKLIFPHSLWSQVKADVGV